MLDLHDKIAEAVAKIRESWSGTPRAGLILGTGLGSLAEQIEVEASFEYPEIPHFPTSTATSHRGRLVCGKLNGLPVVAMEGRFHQYEGYPLKSITLPVRVMKALGAEVLCVSQAVGGMNPYYKPGDVMVIDDHINLLGDNPLVGVNDDRLGPRFPDMSAPYDPQLIEVGLDVARRANFVAHRGVMVAVTGPCLETRAEYRFLRMIGADVVGMSTVPEVIVAVHCGLRVFGVSVITDMCLPDALEPANVEKIIATAGSAEPKLRALFEGVIAHLSSSGRASCPISPMSDTISQVDEAVATIRATWPETPRVAIILGSGLGGLADRVQNPHRFEYSALPHFGQSTAIGHAGRLVCGTLADLPVVCMQGRFHMYEGHPPERVVFPLRVMHALGAKVLVVSNAAGGINPQYKVGDMMVIDDHINLMFANPLVGANDPRLGPRWPDMCAPYDPKLMDEALRKSRELGFVCHRGVYVGMLGPTYETRAEYRLVRRIGGDAVGMSTVPEVIVASQLGMRVLGISTITNACSPDQLGETSGEQVVAAAAAASDKVLSIVEGTLRTLAT